MKKALTLTIGLGIILTFLTTPTYSQINEICYPGNAFIPNSNSEEYTKHFDGYFFSESYHQLNCTVNFPASANGMIVTRLSLSYLDNTATGYVEITLRKIDRWSGKATTVGSLLGSTGGASPDIRYLNLPKSQLAAKGIDNNRYAWYVHGYSTGGEDLRIYQITIRYE